MTALLEHQRIGRRPQGQIPAPPQGRSWRSLDEAREVRPRHDGTAEARRGSERLDELIRHQSPRRPSGRPVRRPARSSAVRTFPHSRVRAHRRPTPEALQPFVREAAVYLRENRRVLGAVTVAALAVLACVVVFSRLPDALRVPSIELAPKSSLDALLLEGRLPEPPSAADSLAPTIVRILSVRQHVVQAGETLSEMASRYGLRLGTIINFNAITDVRSIPVGKKLAIPNADGLLYRVSRGDSLARIAKSYGVTVNSLMDWNDLQSAVIKPGDKLFVPGASMTEDEINGVLGKLFVFPTTGELTSGFGNRMSPIYKQWIFHNGIDIHNRTGTRVIASRAGSVKGVEVHTVYGKTIIIAHSGGYQTMYAHLDTILVRTGQWVAQGAQIGTMGSTGATTGPHLHFSVFKNAEPVDPLKLLH